MKITTMAVVTTAVCLLSTSAWAGPATANSLQIGLGFRYGIEMNEGDFNPWGPGIGASVGYTLPIMPIYVGGNFDYFFGSSVEAGGFETKGKVWHLMAEGGYDVGLADIVVIRPKLGLGPAGMSIETCGMSCVSDSNVKFAIAPGAAFMLFTPVIKLALDLRYAIVLSDPTAKALLFSVGVGF